MRQLIGVGTPRGLQGRLIAVVAALWSLMRSLRAAVTDHGRPVRRLSPIERQSIAKPVTVPMGVQEMVFTTGCYPIMKDATAPRQANHKKQRRSRCFQNRLSKDLISPSVGEP